MNTNKQEVRCMVDCETLGTKPGCVILEVAAVIFDPAAPDAIGAHKRWRIQPRDSFDAGLDIDSETVLWWLSQSEAAVRAVLADRGDRVPLRTALGELRKFFLDHGVTEVWANGPTADCAWLTAAFDVTGMQRPWHFRNERCVRTIGALVPAPVLEEVWKRAVPVGALAHDALNDAVNQARVVADLLRLLAGKEGVRHG